MSAIDNNGELCKLVLTKYNLDNLNIVGVTSYHVVCDVMSCVVEHSELVLTKYNLVNLNINIRSDRSDLMPIRSRKLVVLNNCTVTNLHSLHL